MAVARLAGRPTADEHAGAAGSATGQAGARAVRAPAISPPGRRGRRADITEGAALWGGEYNFGDKCRPQY